MQHERLAALALQAVDDLRIASGAERRHDERLRLTTGEESRAVRARQYAYLDRDRPDGLGIATVDARLAVQDPLAHDVTFQLEERAVDLLRGPLRRFAAGQGGERLGLDLGNARVALLLLRDGVGLREGGLGMQRDGARQFRVLGGRLPAPARLAGLGGELANGADRDLHLLVAEDHRAQHDILRQALGFRLHHEDAFLRTGHDEVQLRLGELRGGRVEEILTVFPPHAGGADRAVEGNAREGERRGSAEERGDVRIHLRVDRQYRRDDLYLVVEAVREERADRAVDEA